MNPGDLNVYCELQSVSTAKDAANQPVETWTKDENVWASIEPLRGIEKFQAETITGETTARVKFRHRTGVTSQQRIKTEDGDIWQFTSAVNVDTKNAEIEAMAVKRG